MSAKGMRAARSANKPHPESPAPPPILERLIVPDPIGTVTNNRALWTIVAQFNHAGSSIEVRILPPKSSLNDIYLVAGMACVYGFVAEKYPEMNALPWRFAKKVLDRLNDFAGGSESVLYIECKSHDLLRKLFIHKLTTGNRLPVERPLHHDYEGVRAEGYRKAILTPDVVSGIGDGLRIGTNNILVASSGKLRKPTEPELNIESLVPFDDLNTILARLRAPSQRASRALKVTDSSSFFIPSGDSANQSIETSAEVVDKPAASSTVELPVANAPVASGAPEIKALVPEPSIREVQPSQRQESPDLLSANTEQSGSAGESTSSAGQPNSLDGLGPAESEPVWDDQSGNRKAVRVLAGVSAAVLLFGVSAFCLWSLRFRGAAGPLADRDESPSNAALVERSQAIVECDIAPTKAFAEAIWKERAQRDNRRPIPEALVYLVSDVMKSNEQAELSFNEVAAYARTREWCNGISFTVPEDKTIKYQSPEYRYSTMRAKARLEALISKHAELKRVKNTPAWQLYVKGWLIEQFGAPGTSGAYTFSNELLDRYEEHIEQVKESLASPEKLDPTRT